MAEETLDTSGLENSENEVLTETIDSSSDSDIITYEEYVDKYKNEKDYVNNEKIVIDKKLLLTEETGSQSVEFKADKTGWYAFQWKYRPVDFGSNDHQITIKIDGEYPYNELKVVDVPRIWLVGETTVLEDGSQVRATSKQDESWNIYKMWDNSAISEKPYMVYLTAGNHTLSLDWCDGAIEIGDFTFYSFEEIPTYEKYVEGKSIYSGEPLEMVEGEDFTSTNSISITSASDLSSSLTTPFSYSKQLINTVGGSNWRYTGQTVEWRVIAPEDGLYTIAIRFKQSYKENMNSYRKLLVNDEVPYIEALAIPFEYENSWQDKRIETSVYLNKGENTIALQSTPGETADLINKLNDAIQRLNTLYRKILMLTGSSPDSYRDYYIEDEIPGIKEEFILISDLLNDVVASAEEVIGSKSAFASASNTIIQLDSITENIRTLTQNGRLGALKQNISALASLSQTLQEQPLSIDSLLLSSPDSPKDFAKETFWQGVTHRVKRFLASFVNDYGSIGENEEATVTIWTAIGRDQLQILKSMIDNDFTLKTGIKADVKLVTGSLIQAVLAGKGPDVVLGQSETNVINYAMRDALVDLSEFPDFDEVLERFSDNAEDPYTYKDGIYGIPQTQTFDMMFVRTDILDELNLPIPKSWNDFTTKVFPVLQRENLLVGVGNLNNGGELVNIFTTLLYQYGGSLYDEAGTSTQLTTPQALDAFDFAVSLYSEYGVPEEYDFVNRFRTGEMPIAISAYSTYNTLQVTAPEIAGLWTMVPIPGVQQEDGTINNTQLMQSAGTIMLKDAKDRTSCWEFIKWWTSADTQRNFGLQQEAILGPSGRYTTANIEAMAGLSWSSSQLKELEEQRAKNKTLKHLPGSYYVGKSLNSAMVTSVKDTTLIPREELMYWAEMIDAEMERKQKEFNYDGFVEYKRAEN